MFVCDLYQAYLDDDTDELPYPCENCAAWIEKTDTCLCEKLHTVQSIYNVTKSVNPKKTTAKAGYDIPALIKSEFSALYAADPFFKTTDLNDLDGVLDYLYGAYNLFKISTYKRLIDFIEKRCEIKK